MGSGLQPYAKDDVNDAGEENHCVGHSGQTILAFEVEGPPRPMCMVVFFNIALMCSSCSEIIVPTLT